MVLITPRIIPESSSQDGGQLEVSFPEESGCEPFSVPLYPTEETLLSWQRCVKLCVSTARPLSSLTIHVASIFQYGARMALKDTYARPA